MAKLDVLTIDGTTAGSIELPSSFDVTPKKGLLHQVVTAYLANQRQHTAHTKTKGEVSGGGRKPWKQKGTGRARAGSSRSPIWIGGGITFGPRSTDNYEQRVPERMRKSGLAMALADKVAGNALIVIDKLTLAEPKTRLASSIINTLVKDDVSVLVVVESYQPGAVRAVRNLPGVRVAQATDVSTYDLLASHTVIATKDSLAILDKRVQVKGKEVEKVTVKTSPDPEPAKINQEPQG